MNELRGLLEEAERLLSDAGSNPGDLAFQQSAIAQALGLMREFVSSFAPLDPAPTGFELTVWTDDDDGQPHQRWHLEDAFEHPWSTQAKTAAIRVLGGIIRAVTDAKEFK